MNDVIHCLYTRANHTIIMIMHVDTEAKMKQVPVHSEPAAFANRLAPQAS